MALPKQAQKSESAALPEVGSRLHYAYVMVALGLICLVGSLGFGRFAYALLLPPMRDEFKTSYTQMGSIATSNALAYMLSALVCGLLASRFGARVVISGALFLCSLGLFWTGTVQGTEQAALAQFLCGLGTGGSVGPVYSIVYPWFTATKRGSATGIMQMGSGLGLVLGGLLVPQLLAIGGGWRFAWEVMGGLVLLISLAAAIFLRNTPAEKGLSAVGSESQSENNSENIRLKSSAMKSDPTSVGEIYRSPRIWLLGAIFACFGLSYVVYTIFFAAHLQNNGFSSQEAGFVWGLAGVVSVGGAGLWGWVADRRGRPFALRTVLLIQGTALAALSFSHTPLTLYLGAMLYGLALWGMPIVISLLAAELAGPRLAAAALGLVIVLFSAGQVVGPVLAGWLKDTSGSLELPLLVAAGIVWFGALMALTVKSRAQQH